MNTVLGAAQPIACSGCGRSIQWHRSLHGRIFVGGLMFRLGGLAVFACIAGALFLPRLPVSYGVAATVAVTLAVVGVLVTYTPASRTFVELASNDA